MRLLGSAVIQDGCKVDGEAKVFKNAELASSEEMYPEWNSNCSAVSKLGIDKSNLR